MFSVCKNLALKLLHNIVRPCRKSSHFVHITVTWPSEMFPTTYNENINYCPALIEVSYALPFWYAANNKTTYL